MPPSENADRSAYTVREVAAIFELSPRQVRRLIADGVVAPERADRGKSLFSFADLVVLRSIADLVRAGVPHARVRTAVAALRDQLPEGATLAEATLEPGGKSVVVRTDDAAWEPEQVAARLMEGIAAGEFYILCEDNETTAEMDRKRILWAAQDITEGRPALSRWHPDWAERFTDWMASD